MNVAEPFYLGHAREYPLADIAASSGAALRPRQRRRGASRTRRSSTARAAATSPTTIWSSPSAPRRVPALPRTRSTFGDDPAERQLHGMLADLEQGYLQRVAFVVPGEAAWTLPLYELALMTARQAWSMGMDRVRFTLVTPEERPLAMFGTPASDAVGELLDDHAHRVRRLARIRASGAATWSRIPAAGGSTPTASSLCRRSTGARHRRRAGRRRRVHPGRRARARPEPAGRLRGGRRHQLPDQAGRPRDPAGRRRGRGDRGRGRAPTSSPSRSGPCCAACC